MHCSIVAALDFTRWEAWLAPAVGFLFAGLSLVVGRFWFHRRRSASRHNPAAPPTSEALLAELQKRNPQDRRTSFRRAATGLKVCVESAVPEQEQLDARLMDRSQEGLGLLMGEELAIGTAIFVHPTGDPNPRAWVRLEVMRKRWDGSRWEIGCRYVTKPSRAFLAALD